MIQRSHPLVVFVQILLRLHIHPRLSNDAFREWRETEHFPTLIFSQTHHAILHWRKDTSQSFALMAQAWVRTSQWPSSKRQWKPHQSRMGSMSLKIKQLTFIGPRGGVSTSGRSIFGPLQWRTQKSTTIRRWTSILQLFCCSEDNSLSKWDITQDAYGNISMTSPYAPSSWVGAEIKGSSVPVSWRPIPAHSYCNSF